VGLHGADPPPDVIVIGPISPEDVPGVPFHNASSFAAAEAGDRAAVHRAGAELAS